MEEEIKKEMDQEKIAILTMMMKMEAMTTLLIWKTMKNFNQLQRVVDNKKKKNNKKLKIAIQ